MSLTKLLAVVALVAVPASSQAARKTKQAPAPAATPAPAAKTDTTAAPAATPALAPIAELERAAEPVPAKHSAAPVGRDEDFGATGQIVPLGSVSFSYETGNGGRSDITIAPGALYFIMDNLAVGAMVGISHQGTSAGSTNAVAFEPMAAYNIPLADKLTLFPQAGISFDHAFGHFSATIVTLDAFAPVLYHITSHFFLGAGPVFDFQLVVPSDSDHSVTIALSTVIGGYFSL